MRIVCDTGPLVALAKADVLNILRELYASVMIPASVEGELLAKPDDETDRLSAALESFVHVEATRASTVGVSDAVRGLGAGERDAISLAADLGATVVIDDRAGRAVAKALGLQVTGTVGVLIVARKAGLLSSVRAAIERMRDEGYYFSDALIAEALRQAGEDA